MVFFGTEASKLMLFDFSLRLFVTPFSIASICIAVTNKEDNTDYGKLEFNNLIGLKYMVFISAISSAYALFAAISSCLNLLVTKVWFFFLMDQVLAYLMVTSMAAFSEFLYLAYKGDQVVSWSQACVSYGKFCNRLIYSLSLHAVAVCCFLILAVISAYRVFKRFEPPFVPSSKECDQQIKT